MNWQRITKESTPLPVRGTKYSDWKTELSIEGYHQCVYCTIRESHFGGIRNFHVEHYKPKGIDRFASLINEFSNLFYACAICNTFKSDDWPADPVDDYSIDCFPDPSVKNYGEIFNVDKTTALLIGKNVTGKYILNKLYLNRPQLIINRKEILIEESYQILIQNVNNQKDILFTLSEKGSAEALQLLREISVAIQSLEAIFHAKETSNPYKQDQTRR